MSASCDFPTKYASLSSLCKRICSPEMFRQILYTKSTTDNLQTNRKTLRTPSIHQCYDSHNKLLPPASMRSDERTPEYLDIYPAWSCLSWASQCLSPSYYPSLPYVTIPFE